MEECGPTRTGKKIGTKKLRKKNRDDTRICYCWIFMFFCSFEGIECVDMGLQEKKKKNSKKKKEERKRKENKET